jgi:hypothetical protein
VEKFFGIKLHDKYEEAVTAYEGSPDSNTVVRREA